MATRPPALGEFGRIERYFQPLARNFPGALGLADDAAILAPPPGQELVVTTDAIVAGIHFLPEDAPRDIARKALRVNLSDLAAKGARPFAYMLSLAVGRDVDDDWVAGFADGLASDQAQFGIALAGGDSVSTPGPVWASITAFGLVEAGQMVRRSGADAGDIVLVTGTIGDAALGLAVAQGRLEALPEDCAALYDRYRLPRPRTDLAPAIGRWATAALDVSDGLVADFGHLCRASSVVGRIDAPLVPLSPFARRAVDAGGAQLDQILTGGDDYEVLLTAKPGAVPSLKAAAAAAGIDLSAIGVITRSQNRDRAGAVVVLDQAGAEMTFERTGWSHS